MQGADQAFRERRISSGSVSSTLTMWGSHLSCMCCALIWAVVCELTWDQACHNTQKKLSFEIVRPATECCEFSLSLKV